MGRRSEYYATVGELTVGYSCTERAGGYLGVRFVGPDGKRRETMTGCRRRDPDYHAAALRIVSASYATEAAVRSSMTFADAIGTVLATTRDLRPATLLAYKKCLAGMVLSFDQDKAIKVKPVGPADVTEAMATGFGRAFLAQTYRRGKASDSVVRRRTPVTLSYYLRGLSGLWGHFQDCGIVSSNPWRAIRHPVLTQKKKPTPTEAEISHFLSWLSDRYPSWELLHCLISVKMARELRPTATPARRAFEAGRRGHRARGPTAPPSF